MPGKFNELVAHVTGGRRYCFVIMSYHDGFAFFERIRTLVAQATGFECIRADDLPGAGEDLRAKIHDAVDNSVFVIADVSNPRPNIYYEVGYASARNKPVLLLLREGAEIHTDLLGVELIRYSDNRDGWPRFEIDLRRHLDVHRDSNVSLLRAMVLPTDPSPSFIVLNPKQPRPDSRFQHHPLERRTYGDYLGLSGILGAFLSVYGEHAAPEIVSASHADDGLAEWDASLYLIGSPKVNKFTAPFLNAMQRGVGANWHFDGNIDGRGIQDYEMQLVGELPTGTFQTPTGGFDKNDRLPIVEDYGLIIRGPHPRHSHRSVLVLAGPHSVGTGAACLAATKPQLVQAISQSLAGKAELGDRRKTIWVLVRGKTESGHVDASRVDIVDVGVC